MAKAKRDRRTSIRNINAGDDALAALERLEQLEQQHEASQTEALAESSEGTPSDETDVRSGR